ncbi:hypothetical protein ACFOOM_22970 [Streptomyces echinoruber]|uniref:Flavohemoprotein n=1 Tax=Streptomyces echinoruber TaxID=68898 RepID=A0A918R1N4_9ACTN|nr:hypothetical protein [Streptomyces echinoruber]GGZ83069.1 hypothetical protein GCM10010389_21400 [Streptomyces echinoruber]
MRQPLERGGGRAAAASAALRAARMYLWDEKDARSLESVNGVFGGLMDLTAVDLPDDALYHLCGPLPFTQAVRSRLIERGIAPHDIQYEVFGPDLRQADVA